MTLPDPIPTVCDAWLGEIDRRAPELVTGLYLRGGIGFGEYVAGKSDIDFVATLSHRAVGEELVALEESHTVVHTRHPELSFDGCHVLPPTWLRRRTTAPTCRPSCTDCSTPKAART